MPPTTSYRLLQYVHPTITLKSGESLGCHASELKIWDNGCLEIASEKEGKYYFIPSSSYITLELAIPKQGSSNDIIANLTERASRPID